MKTTYTAIFADGTKITRKSERAYTAAWRSTWTADGKVCVFTGFSVSAEKASPYAPAPFWGGQSSGGRAEAKRKNEEFRASCGYRVEVVPAVAA